MAGGFVDVCEAVVADGGELRQGVVLLGASVVACDESARDIVAAELHMSID